MLNWRVSEEISRKPSNECVTWLLVITHADIVKKEQKVQKKK